MSDDDLMKVEGGLVPDLSDAMRMAPGMVPS